VFVAENIAFQLKLNLLDSLTTIVGNVNIDVDARSANPDLPVQASCYSDNFDGSITRFEPLVRRSEGAR
jgi:hypothetical protein